MEAIFITTDIKVDNVAFYQWSGIWDSMTDDFVDGSAAAPWELIIIKWRRIGIISDDIVMDHFVDLLGCHTWSYNCMTSVQSASSNLTSFSNNFNFFSSMHWWYLVR